ncbi:Mss4-like protein [Roridomyces roridus]|uniref:Mss4-like protein n=1 Tax=Roridomyces roridus TaxID=1738132 RepID=A0AAD7BCM4_9AGAR|nr:Mss4-like protein [Roridomyces roridus]
MPTDGALLRGSCHCGVVKFSLKSSTPVPYQLCLCSICRKVAGPGGSINLGGHSETLKIEEGKEHIRPSSTVDRDTPKQRIASSERNFCSKCSTMLWLYDESWPELIHPFAPAIDNLDAALTEALGPQKYDPEKLVLVCIKNDSKPACHQDHTPCPSPPEGPKETYDGYGTHSLARRMRSTSKRVCSEVR